jgi:DNA-directed RNA polymerase sigma subunit (sigma70/sigma32)
MISIYLHGRMTLKQVSERLDVSIARIKQIETKALEKVKAVLKNNINALGISE